MSNVRCLMFLGSPHLTIDSVNVALGSAAISLVSLGVAAVLAWKTKLSPASLVGTMPYAIVWTFFEQTTGKPSGYFLVPTFWLSNAGARAALVEDMRLLVRVPNGKPLMLYPVHSVPLEAIESPMTFKEKELLRAGLAPFFGFSVPSGERWVNNYVFPLNEASRAALTGETRITVELKAVAQKRFKPVLEQRIAFGKSSFDWLQWAGVGGPSASYYYSEVWRNRAAARDI